VFARVRDQPQVVLALSLLQVSAALQRYVDELNADLSVLPTRGPCSKYVLPEEDFKVCASGCSPCFWTCLKWYHTRISVVTGWIKVVNFAANCQTARYCLPACGTTEFICYHVLISCRGISRCKEEAQAGYPAAPPDLIGGCAYPVFLHCYCQLQRKN
jgi:hypothetical protein